MINKMKTNSRSIDGGNHRNWQIAHHQEFLVELLKNDSHMAEGLEDFAINWLVSLYQGGMYLHHTDVVLCCVPVSLQQPIQVSPSTECFPSTLQTKLFTVFNLLEHSPPVRMAALSPFFSCSSPTLAVSSLPMSSVRAFSLLGLFRVITAT